MAKASASATKLERVENVLGGKRVLGASVNSTIDCVPLVRRGLPYPTVESVARVVAATTEDIARWLGLARRTLDRRRASGRLDALSSERVLRLATVVARARDVLGEDAAMRNWLREPNRALGGVAPVELLDTDIGAQAVLDTLGRLEHGVFS